MVNLFFLNFLKNATIKCSSHTPKSGIHNICMTSETKPNSHLLNAFNIIFEKKNNNKLFFNQPHIVQHVVKKNAYFLKLFS